MLTWVILAGIVVVLVLVCVFKCFMVCKEKSGSGANCTPPVIAIDVGYSKPSLSEVVPALVGFVRCEHAIEVRIKEREFEFRFGCSWGVVDSQS